MAVVAQRKGVRLVGFQKSGHTSLINMFLTPASLKVRRGVYNTPGVLNTGDQAVKFDAMRGDIAAAQTWPSAGYTIAFFRYPPARMMSAYQHFLKRTQRESFLDLGFDPGMSFEEFAEHLAANPHIMHQDNHLKPQADSYDEARSSTGVICRLEEVDELWPWVVEKLDLECVKRVSRFNKGKYSEVPTRQAAKMIEFLYAKDLHYWNTAIRGKETRAPIPSVRDKVSQ